MKAPYPCVIRVTPLAILRSQDLMASINARQRVPQRDSAAADAAAAAPTGAITTSFASARTCHRDRPAAFSRLTDKMILIDVRGEGKKNLVISPSGRFGW